MIKSGKFKITETYQDGTGFIDRFIRTVNVVTNNDCGLSLVYANQESELDEVSYDYGETWVTQSLTIEKNSKVYVEKTIDEVVNIYKRASNSIVEWITPLTEVVT